MGFDQRIARNARTKLVELGELLMNREKVYSFEVCEGENTLHGLYHRLGAETLQVVCDLQRTQQDQRGMCIEARLLGTRQMFEERSNGVPIDELMNDERLELGTLGETQVYVEFNVLYLARVIGNECPSYSID